MCSSGWWCLTLWGFWLYLSPFICLPSCVLLGGGLRLSGFLALFVSFHLSPFMCPSGWWCPALWVSRFICLPSCVLLGGGVRLSGFLALFVSLHVSFWVVVSGFLGFSLYLSLFHLSPFMCPSGWWCPALWVSRFICLPSCVLLGGGVRLSGFLALFVSLHLSPFMCPSGWWCPAL